MRISKGVGWRGVQPEWCMMVPLVPAGTALALTVRRARSHGVRDMLSAQNYPDITVAEGPGRTDLRGL